MAGSLPVTQIEPQSLAQYLDKVKAVINAAFEVPEWVSAEIVEIVVKARYAILHLTALKGARDVVKSLIRR
jgi:hypothetical protein